MKVTITILFNGDASCWRLEFGKKVPLKSTDEFHDTLTGLLESHFCIDEAEWTNGFLMAYHEGLKRADELVGIAEKSGKRTGIKVTTNVV